MKRKCTACQQEKRLSKFSPRKGARLGVSSHCKQCRREMAQGKREKMGKPFDTSWAYRGEETREDRHRRLVAWIKKDYKQHP